MSGSSPLEDTTTSPMVTYDETSILVQPAPCGEDPCCVSASSGAATDAWVSTTIYPPSLPLPPAVYPHRKTLVLDLDGTLIASEEIAHAQLGGWTVSSRAPDYQALGRRVWLRPGVNNFLESVRPHFEVVLFTAATSGWAKAALERLDPESRLFDAMLHRQHTVADVQWEYVKDLSRLGRDLANVVIVDDNASMFMYQPSNALQVAAYEVAKRTRATGLYGAVDDAEDEEVVVDRDDVLAHVAEILLQQVVPAADVREVLGPMAASKTVIRPSSPPASPADDAEAESDVAADDTMLAAQAEVYLAQQADAMAAIFAEASGDCEEDTVMLGDEAGAGANAALPSLDMAGSAALEADLDDDNDEDMPDAPASSAVLPRSSTCAATITASGASAAAAAVLPSSQHPQPTSGAAQVHISKEALPVGMVLLSDLQPSIGACVSVTDSAEQDPSTAVAAGGRDDDGASVCCPAPECTSIPPLAACPLTQPPACCDAGASPVQPLESADTTTGQVAQPLCGAAASTGNHAACVPAAGSLPASLPANDRLALDDSSGVDELLAQRGLALEPLTAALFVVCEELLALAEAEEAATGRGCTLAAARLSMDGGAEVAAVPAGAHAEAEALSVASTDGKQPDKSSSDDESLEAAHAPGSKRARPDGEEPASLGGKEGDAVDGPHHEAKRGCFDPAAASAAAVADASDMAASLPVACMLWRRAQLRMADGPARGLGLGLAPLENLQDSVIVG